MKTIKILKQEKVESRIKWKFLYNKKRYTSFITLASDIGIHKGATVSTRINRYRDAVGREILTEKEVNDIFTMNKDDFTEIMMNGKSKGGVLLANLCPDDIKSPFQSFCF